MLFAISSAIAVKTVVVTALPNYLYAWLSETTCFQSSIGNACKIPYSLGVNFRTLNRFVSNIFTSLCPPGCCKGWCYSVHGIHPAALVLSFYVKHPHHLATLVISSFHCLVPFAFLSLTAVVYSLMREELVQLLQTCRIHSFVLGLFRFQTGILYCHYLYPLALVGCKRWG